MKETKKIHIGVMGGKGSGKKTFLKMQDPSNKSLDQVEKEFSVEHADLEKVIVTFWRQVTQNNNMLPRRIADRACFLIFLDVTNHKGLDETRRIFKDLNELG